uniref:Transmembrane protein n=1 Tax=Chromera velia CCMP2878 TaxID=1169474 RepID=A0A0G4ICL3_9ALVE|mmetsp:Transcript_27208/g.53459  ORF Transcript_27208/g.53459 Transcript_27208/m.53459 type:complete len:192 (+) Transcript_27208:210-785(+)|eukprot:Cvel_2261.t1-p1 / transcript=Cvel_2261.t1 / gene=Cvel_2261 / organism=Chromera_velia_CCMP2878 / gene_product=hypothetical protein / transcript_product=hypothetical protein / location=Cvel_scaffold87:97700-100656(-) / protein_length=191 / sequence_SO=supercontig / SO=protein_coding / is_pseudo=false
MKQCCCSCTLRTGVLLLALISVLNALQGVTTGYSVAFTSAITIICGTIGFLAAYQRDVGLLQIYFYFQIASAVFAFCALLAVFLLIIGAVPVAFQMPPGAWDDQGIRHTSETIFIYFLVVFIFLSIGFAIQLYSIFVTESFIKVLQAGGTGDELMSPEELKSSKSREEAETAADERGVRGEEQSASAPLLT